MRKAIPLPFPPHEVLEERFDARPFPSFGGVADEV